jgi:hypothetical protein
MGHVGSAVAGIAVTVGVSIAVGAIIVASGGTLAPLALAAICGASGGLAGGIFGTALAGGSGMDYVKAGIGGAIAGGLGGFAGSWASSATKALGALPGAFAGGVAGGFAGGVAGGLSGGINNVLFGGGSFGDGFESGFKSGFISGAIGGALGGGYRGYKLAQAQGANPWTGSQITNSRSYSSSGYGNPAAYRQPDPTRDCGAYNRGFANNTNPNNYIPLENADGGADMAQLLRASGSRGVDGVWSSDADWDIVGSHMNNGASVFSTAGAHNYTIVALTVSDKANLFFGGIHQVVSSSTVFNSLSGSLQSGGGVLDRITWGY